MSSDISVCCICNSEFKDGDVKTSVGSRGMKNFISCSLQRGDGKHVIWKNQNNLIIHEECRVSYISKERVAVAKKRKLSAEPTINELSTVFDYKNCCVICALPCNEKLEIKKPKKYRRKIHFVMENSTFKNRILEQCNKCTNESVNEVVKRFNDVDSLFSVGAKYHHNCDVNFLSKLVSLKPSVNVRNTQFDKQFEKLFEFLENSEEPQWTLNEIMNVLGEPAPSRKYVKKVLSERYGDDIIFSSYGKDRTIVNLKGFAEDLILDYFKNNISAENENEKKSNILKLAAKYIREDIRGMAMETEYYAPSNGFFDNNNINHVVPKSLTSFLSDIILPHKQNIQSSKKKITAISHSIIAAVRPKSFISSLQLALATYIHSKHQSKLLINMLNRLGMSASYDETLLYEGSAVVSATPISQASHESFVQYVFDNADYDVRTIDERNIFHYTGDVECITPASSSEISLSIKHLDPPPQASAIANEYKVEMYDYTVPEAHGLSNVKIKDVRTLRSSQSEPEILQDWQLTDYDNTCDEVSLSYSVDEQLDHREEQRIDVATPGPSWM